jgi:DNA-binding MarR family transcriptional regulator
MVMSAFSPDLRPEHLLRLSTEVSRVAGTLARLSADPNRIPPRTETDAGPLDVAAERINAVIRARRLRGRFLPDELFADPAWDMLLDLLQAEVLQQRVAVSSLCAAAAVPATTALRWLNTLVNRGLIVRVPDPMDARRVFVQLAPETSIALRQYFAEVADELPI